MSDQLRPIENLTRALSANPELVKLVSTSVLDPVAYILERKEELALRGINTPVDWLPWVALVDGLQGDGELMEFDWKESKIPIVRGLIQIVQRRGHDKKLLAALEGLLPLLPDHTQTLFRRLGATFRDHGQVLVMIDLGADSYPITTVEVDLWPSVKLLADEVDHGRLRDMRE